MTTTELADRLDAVLRRIHPKHRGRPRIYARSAACACRKGRTIVAKGLCATCYARHRRAEQVRVISMETPQ